MNDTAGAPLMENIHVKELFSIMRNNNADTTNLAAMINHVAAMQRYLETANEQLAAMRRELVDMREIQKHPFKMSLQNSINTLEGKVNSMREQLDEIKAVIIEGCKNAVAAFKEKSASALNSVMSFFNIKQGLQEFQKQSDAAIHTNEIAISNIEAFSQQYHEAEKAIKNMGRAIRGKKAIQEAKPVGKLAKAMKAPFKAFNTINVKMRNAAVKAASSLEKLNADVTTRKAERAAAKPEKSSLLKRLDENKERVKRDEQERSLPTRVRTPQEIAV